MCKSRNRLAKTTNLAVAAVGAALVASGCAHVDATPKIHQAMELAEQHVGERPAWTAPWDDAPPEWDGESVLTTEAAVTLALRNNRALRAEIEMIGQASADLVQAGLLTNPVINLMAMFPSGGGRAMLRGNGAPMQAIQDLWLIPARKETAEAQLRSTVLRAADRAVEVAADVKRTYARIQYTQRAIELTQENIAIVDQSIRLIQSRQTGGRATQVEVNVARIRRLRLQSELLAMEAEGRSLKRELLMQVGFAAAVDHWRVTPVHELEDTLDSPPQEAELLSAALDQRLDLQAAQWSVSAADRDVQLARREAWPDLAIGLGFERSGAPRSQNPTFAGQAGNAAAGALAGREAMAPDIMPFSPKPREMKWMVGPMLELEVPVFDQNQAQIAKAMFMLRQRFAEFEAMEQRVVREIRETLVMYEQALAQVRLFRDEIIPEVDRNLKLVQQSYRSGTDEFTVYLQAQEDLISTRLNALAFLRDTMLQRTDLERRVGGRLPEIATEVIEDASAEKSTPTDLHDVQPGNQP